jgi:hypothetical protein
VVPPTSFLNAYVGVTPDLAPIDWKNRMQTTTLANVHGDRSDSDVAGTRSGPTDRTLTVTASYALSDDGRKRSLLAGGDGRSRQHLTIAVPTSRLHLVTVDANGHARLKLHPRYELTGDHQVVRIETPPVFDAPPDLDTLLQQAARNHQLERTYEAQRHAARAARRQADHERRAQLADAFLADASQRAVPHPPPTPNRCFLVVNGARVLFDVRTDQGSARAVPPEAHRRLRADLRARAERGQQERAAQLAVHEQKKIAVAEWVDAYGTPDQRSRHAAGVLPIEEVVEAITDRVFSPLREWTPYTHDGARRLQARLRRMPSYADVAITDRELAVTSRFPSKASASQWARVTEAQQLVADALVALRTHTIAWTRDRHAPSVTVVGVLITKTEGPFTLRREYVVEES